jgi:pSer/pThr/pTyr-binding forkhead associated (FHA) protein
MEAARPAATASSSTTVTPVVPVAAAFADPPPEPAARAEASVKAEPTALRAADRARPEPKPLARVLVDEEPRPAPRADRAEAAAQAAPIAKTSPARRPRAVGDAALNEPSPGDPRPAGDRRILPFEDDLPKERPSLALVNAKAGERGERGERAGTDAKKGSGRLVVIVEDGSEGRSFALGDGLLDIGRTEGDIVLEDDPYVSPRHARLRRTAASPPSWCLQDLDSTNRVYLRLRKPHVLRDGDLLLLGLEVLQFQTVNDGERGLGHAIQHGTFVFGSPATPRRARLCQRTVEGVTRDVYHLFRDETIIGREVGDVVFTADPFLSRRHAAVRRNPVSSEFTLVDLDSSNGSYVAVRGEVAIGDGDFLRIGQHLFRVDLA